ncbi:MAG: hypothetical protein WB443_15820, partial [Nitrososphaeraceae archaeon]
HKLTSLQKVLENANKAIGKSTKFINKIKSRQIAYAKRAKSRPENATIRKEYIKCGKEICEQKHGPYCLRTSISARTTERAKMLSRIRRLFSYDHRLVVKRWL